MVTRSLKCVTSGLAVLVFLVSHAVGWNDSAPLQPLALRCEYRHNPQGIDEPHPRLYWRVESDARGQKQTAYRLLVASTPEILANDEGDLWDSGKIASSQTTHIPYDGKPLVSRQPCFWKVQAWDRDGVASTWSQPASWSMGLLLDSDWSAEYISYRDESPVFKDRDAHFLPPARQYRKEFVAGKKIKRATVYATALGIYELELNGQRVGDAYFAPGWTDYLQRAYYNTYDVTELVRRRRQRDRRQRGGWLVQRVRRFRVADRHRDGTDWSLHLRQDALVDGPTGDRVRRWLTTGRRE